MAEPQQKPGRSKQDYQTPRAFVDAVKFRLGVDEFSFDFAADDAGKNRVAESWWGPYCDSLSKTRQNWVNAASGGFAWLNPPFADIAPWAERCKWLRQDGGSVALLVPAGVGSNWFRDHVAGQALVLFLNGRLSFDGVAPYPKDCVLALYAPHFAPGYEVWTWARKVAA